MPTADLSALLEGLLRSDVEFILVGGLAAVIQGAPITTIDADIVHRQSPENISRLFAFLESVNAVYRRPDGIIIAPKKKDFSKAGHVLLTTCLGPLDVLAFIEGGKTYDDLYRHSVQIDFRGRAIRVLDIKMLTELKRISKSPEDKQRLALLEATLRQMEKDQDMESGTR